jgi:hypothetical protein
MASDGQFVSSSEPVSEGRRNSERIAVSVEQKIEQKNFPAAARPTSEKKA